MNCENNNNHPLIPFFRQGIGSQPIDFVLIRKIVYGLLQAGLVELVRPPDASKPQQSSTRRRRTQTPQVKKTVVNKIISRIKDL